MGTDKRNKTKAGSLKGAEQDDLIWGINAVAEALTHQPEGIAEIFIQKGKAGPRLQQIIDQARGHGTRLRFVEPSRMGVPRSVNHQGVVARSAAIPLIGFEQVLSELSQAAVDNKPRLLILDSLQDPRNVGSILRSALGAGFSHIILTRERSVSLTGTVARTSAGAVSQLTVCQVVNLAEALQKLKSAGYWVFGAVAPEEKSESIYAVDFSGPICLVIGSEGKGIRPLVRKQCDHLVTIPMRKGFDSLNAAVAAAVIMFEIHRRAICDTEG